jgi:hypothetical protein
MTSEEKPVEEKYNFKCSKCGSKHVFIMFGNLQMVPMKTTIIVVGLVNENGG